MKDSIPVKRSEPSARAVGFLDTTIDARDDAAHLVDGAGLLWDRMMLSAAPAAAVRPPSMAVPAELRFVLRLFDAAADGSTTGGPSVPSAGARYPYEHYAVVVGLAGPAVYAVDAIRRGCRLVRTGPQVVRALERSGLRVPMAGESLVLTVVRPWLSMSKYGNRGYLYAQLDAAHLTAHLYCLAAGSHVSTELRTRMPTAPLSELLELNANCRFVHSVLVLGGPRHAGAGPDIAWTCADDRGNSQDRRAAPWLETECWKWLTAHRATGPVLPAADDGRLRHLLVDAPLWEADPAPDGATLGAAAARRRSAKDFTPAPLYGPALDRALVALRTPLSIDLPPSTGLSATLIARRVTDRTPGSHPLFRGGSSSSPMAPAPEDEELVRACMGQEHLRHAAALVLFHVPRQELLRGGGRAIDEALLRAGTLAHLLYLGAAAAEVDVTAIGGFDASRWSSLAGLPARHEVLYVVLLGPSGKSTVKIDRLHPAYAHNER
ncbi:nitroreductase family protein [Streptomyces sp. DT24]|uniref:nitroreductase family protein n=1 Tax=unclassified Streptomyces TaxID=2593676 RepID=UPI003CE915AB